VHKATGTDIFDALKDLFFWDADEYDNFDHFIESGRLFAWL